MASFNNKSFATSALILTLAGALIGCGNLSVEHEYPDNSNGATKESGSIFDNFTFAKGDEPKGDGPKSDDAKTEAINDGGTQEQAASAAPQGLAVNGDLWRAGLDTIRFMPLAAADPTGGTIITDWYNDPGSDSERVKINIVISGLALRADALRVSVFREKWRGNRWVSMAASPRAARQMENIILTRARDFNLARRQSR